MHSEIAVVGGGAIGATAAADLAAKGFHVTLYEKGDLAAGSSGRAAGVCYDAFADRTDATIGSRSLERFRELSNVFTEWPYVWFAHTDDEKRASAIRRQAKRMRDLGRDVTLVEPTELGERFPGLKTNDINVAAMTHGAGYANTTEYVEVMVDRARQNGASVQTETPVELTTDPPGIVSDGGEQLFDAVLVAGGAHTKRILATGNVSIPMKPYRVQALVTEATPTTESVPMCYDATDSYYFRPYEDGLLIGDGTERVESNPDEWNRAADEEFVEKMRGHLDDRIPDKLEVRDTWAGLCTATPDGDPLFGEIRSGVFVATGFHGHGFMRAPALGEHIAEQILGGDGVSRFDPTRFDGSETFDIIAGMDIE
ncbi:NAD(P)/FAD-dependent oxidoreductase [Halococcus sediminicola]|uniref:NAD(P)/FAD-dependent oxidoreductase n=1 Tax=Halococcus sediminicola TaxID=1264579 RepID=UPI000678A09D|nr:FAD-dependent oxidoreductase [Halococcus sediminicola]